MLRRAEARDPRALASRGR